MTSSPSPHSNQIAEIIERLTEVQRIAVLAIAPDGTWADDAPFAHSLYPAYEACLASREWCPGVRYRLTREGLEVHSALREAASKARAKEDRS